MENTPSTESLVQQNKKLKLFLIIFSVVTVLLLSLIIVILLLNKSDASDDIYTVDQTEPIDQDIPEENSSEFQLAQTTDVSNYTDIVLSDYKGLYVEISTGLSPYPSFPSGEVIYNPKSYLDHVSEELVEGVEPGPTLYELYGPFMRMEIINEKILSNQEQETLFEQARMDILNKNLEAEDFEVGYLEIFRDSLGDAAYKAVKEIEVNYPNTDSVFGVLFLGGYQDGPFAYPSKEENIGAPLTLKVYAVKGDNLISLSSFFFDTSEIGVSKEDHDACTIEDSDEYSPTYEGYFDVNCLSEVLQSDEYDEKIQEFTDDLVERFELAE
ncbi:MAG: hypothetical protein XD93_0824 [candidate division WS6 bacterium 34_10]|uniref:Uncharacterized protein n=1 Tax=candidate division WS6 bacterium 34_10 TaxID=1641389 RepID=A0A101HGV6_9BACT|nr:MAG: hypothetical protein XD93_0824 [candidate division WS6 bacterium 34_10]